MKLDRTTESVSSDLTVERITELEDLEKLREPWRKLAQACQQPFLEPAWTLLWLRHFGGRARPYVLEAKDGDRLVGLLPLVWGRSRWLLGARVISFPGQLMADYQGLLAAEGSAEVAQGFADRLASFRDWDLLWLSDLQADDPVSGHLVQSLRGAGLRVTTVPSLVCPYMSISGSWREYYEQARSNGVRKNLRWAMRKLEEIGSLEFRHYAGPGDVQERLEDTFGLHSARWSNRFTTTPYSAAGGRAFFGELAVAYAKQGLLDLATLELDGRPIAFSFSFSYPDRYFYYIPAFDPQHAAYSPGTLLMMHLMERVFDRGCAFFDFMKGDEAYKWQWTREYRTNFGMIVANRTLSGWTAEHMLHGYQSLRGRIRQWEVARRLRRETLGRVLGASKRLRRKS